jgi:hypothetical protein
MSDVSSVGDGSSFSSTVSLPFNGFPGSNTGSQDQHFGVGHVPASGSGGGGPGTAPPALPPGISDPNAGRETPDAILGVVTPLGDVIARGTATQLLAQWPSLLSKSHADGKNVGGGPNAPSLALPGGSVIQFPSEAAATSYLQRSAAPTDSTLSNTFASVLGRSPGADELAKLRTDASQGKSLADMRADLAKSPEVVRVVDAFYQKLFGPKASPSATDLTNCENALAAGQSLADQQAGLRKAFARSDAEGAAVGGLYKDVLGRTQAPSQGEVASKEDAIANGASYADVRADMAKSSEAAARISQLYTDVLGRTQAPSQDEVAHYQDQLASGAMTMDQVRYDLAHSKEAAGQIAAFYQSVFGPDATVSDADLASCQAALAAGQSLKDQQAYLRQAFSGSAAENAAVDNAYLAKLGRHADAGGLAVQEAALTAGTPLSTIEASLATSQEATQNIEGLYQDELGRPADPAGFAAQQSALASGTPPSVIRANIATSSEATVRINGAYWDAFGRDASAAEMTASQNALANGASLDDLKGMLAVASQFVSKPITPVAYNPRVASPQPGDAIGPYGEGYVPLAQVPANALGILQYRALFQDPKTGTYSVGFSFPSGYEVLPTYNKRGQTPDSVEVGFTVTPPGVPSVMPGNNPMPGLRIGFSSYHPSLLGQSYFITYINAGQPISPITGKTVGNACSHYPLDTLNTLAHWEAVYE